MNAPMARAALLVLLCLLALPAAATAQTPLMAAESAPSFLSINWSQGATADPAGRWFFAGTTQLTRTSAELKEEAKQAAAIPQQLQEQGFNHIGDPAFVDGKVVLPLECFTNGANTCGKGALSFNDPETLAPTDYVVLEGVAKAMWVATDGTDLFTSDGDDLLAYPVAQPGAAPRRMSDVLPTSGITGGAVFEGRLYVASGHTKTSGGTPLQLHSLDLDEPATTLRLEHAPQRNGQPLRGESEGLEIRPAFDGLLHWVVASDFSNSPNGYGLGTVMLHLRPTPAPDVKLTLERRATQWAVTATNVGTAPASAVDVDVTAADAFGPLAFSSPGFTCSARSGGPLCAHGELAAGTGSTIALGGSTPPPGRWELRARAATPGDYVRSNDVVSDVVEIPAPAGGVPPGETITTPPPVVVPPPIIEPRLIQSRVLRVGRLRLRLTLRNAGVLLTVRGGRLRTAKVRWLLDGKRLATDRRAAYAVKLPSKLAAGKHRLRALFRPHGAKRVRWLDLVWQR